MSSVGALALPDPIHNSCVWGAINISPSISYGVEYVVHIIWTTYCVGVDRSSHFL